LFAGIGGFDLGFERAGMECRWQVEIDPYCQRVLAKHWPSVRRWDDVKSFPPSGEWGVDCIIGGPPCQPTSAAGKQLGSADDRWLWPDTLRIIRTLPPQFAILENPTAILSLDRGRAFAGIIAHLAESGYDAEWQCLSAASVGAPHIRERTFICAYPAGMFGDSIFGAQPDGNLSSHAYSRILADAYRSQGAQRQGISDDALAQLSPAQRSLRSSGAWDRGPFDDGAMDDGISTPVDSLDAYGNAVVPQVAQWIGEKIVEATK